METAAARLVADILTNAGYEIILLRNAPAFKIQVWIDRQPEPVNIDDCIRMTRTVWEAFEAEDLDPGDFELEIQSPGLDRFLTKPAHFERFEGKQIKVRLQEKDELGRRNFTGKLLGYDEEQGVKVLCDEEHTFHLDLVAECRLVPVAKWAKAPEPGTRTRKPTKSRRKKPKGKGNRRR